MGKRFTYTRVYDIIYYRKGVNKLDTIKKLIKLMTQLNELGLKVLELLGTVTLIALSIKSLLQMI